MTEETEALVVIAILFVLPFLFVAYVIFSSRKMNERVSPKSSAKKQTKKKK